ncbi:uncharacterized protein B0H18DRAFT_896350, partial [Fomitopsis serialis]|uniref:uncharacterized protein n=1 Tax=Fomitopsis serialis TaxID=139415 RepID=UPI002007CDC5
LGFYLFDFCLTFDQQVKFLWNRKLSIPSVLLALMHSSTMIFALSYQACTLLTCQWLIMWPDPMISAISALRVYAINGRHWQLPSLIFAVAIPGIVQDIVCIHADWFPCLVISKLMWASPVAVASTIVVFTANILVLGATWYHTLTVKKLAGAAGQNTTLVTLLLRDGKSDTIH